MIEAKPGAALTAVEDAPAGRDLDRCMASIMGDWQEDGWWYSKDGSKVAHEDGGPRKYSTDIIEAWRVVEKLNADGMWWTADGAGRRGLPVRFRFSTGDQVEAATLPLAICRAAILAMEMQCPPGPPSKTNS